MPALLAGLLATTLGLVPGRAAAAEAAAPPAPVLVRTGQTVTITDADPKAVVLYSLDGSDPDNRAGPYLAPILLETGGKVRARAFSPDLKVRSEEAVIELPLPEGKKALPNTLVPVTQGRESFGYDWAARHREIKAEIAKTKPSLVFLGDSITHHFGGPPRDRDWPGVAVWNEAYAPLHAVDLGYGWDRVENQLWRLAVDDELAGASPKVAVVMIGTNNIGINNAQEIADGIGAVCAALHQRHPTTKILLLGIFPRSATPDTWRALAAEVNKLLVPLDGHGGVTVLDISASFIAADGTISKDVMGDGLHPTEAGYRIWVKAMKPTLDRLLAK